MVKFALTLPSGLSVSFEGDPEGFDRFVKFLTGDFQSLVPALAAGDDEDNGQGHRSQLEPLGEQGPISGLDPHAINEKLNEIGATSDQERITVITHIAETAGMPGLDYDGVDQIYTALGLKKPATWRSLFFNTKARGYIRSVGPGLWRTTVAGQNLARLGHRVPARRKGGK